MTKEQRKNELKRDLVVTAKTVRAIGRKHGTNSEEYKAGLREWQAAWNRAHGLTDYIDGWD